MINIDRDIGIKLLPFDTDIFGIKCGKVEINNEFLLKEKLSVILDKTKKEEIKHLVVKVPSEWVTVCNMLEDFNFRFKICSLDLEKVVEEIGNFEDVVLYEKNNDHRLIEITAKSFASGTRFHFEHRFSQEQVSELYKRWICNLINDKDVKIYINCINEIITGFVTVKIEDDISRKGHIGLFAVDKEYKGKGIGSKLLSALNSKLFNKVDVLSVITESINYGALKTYLKNGFYVKKSWNVFHCNFF